MGATKRRKYTAEFKSQLVLEILSGKKSVPQIAREKRIKDSALYRWKAEAMEKFPLLFEIESTRPESDRRMEELEQVIGRLTVENEALKKSVELAGAGVADKRMMVKAMTPKYGSVRELCQMVGLAESSYHYQPQGRVDGAPDSSLLSALVALAGRYPTYGYRRLGVLLRGQKAFSQITDKCLRRVVKQANLRAKTPHKRVSTTNSAHGFRRYPNLLKTYPQVSRPDQVWVSDITYIRLADGSFVYLAIVLDLFTRAIRGWHLGRDITHQLALSALNMALKKAAPQIHHSDQGVQYATPLYTDALTSRHIRISMSDKGMAWQNGYAERFMLTIKEEEVYLNEYRDFDDALSNIASFINSLYNKKRIHSALGYISPAQFEAVWRKNNTVNSQEFLS